MREDPEGFRELKREQAKARRGARTENGKLKEYQKARQDAIRCLIRPHRSE